MLPSADEIGARVIEANVHVLIVPRLPERIVRYGPFVEPAVAMRAAQRLLDPPFSLLHFFWAEYHLRSQHRLRPWRAVGVPAYSLGIDGVYPVACGKVVGIFVVAGSGPSS